jgi:site-specific DNA-cytosine methylase
MSEACQQLIQTLKDLDFSYQQFILSPSMFSVPNTRHRYYIIAKRRPLYFNFPLQPRVVSMLLQVHFRFMQHINASSPCVMCHPPLLFHQVYGQSDEWATLI